eukprot:6308324-Amphidinium_carterae.1
MSRTSVWNGHSPSESVRKHVLHCQNQIGAHEHSDEFEEALEEALCDRQGIVITTALGRLILFVKGFLQYGWVV